MGHTIIRRCEMCCSHLATLCGRNKKTIEGNSHADRDAQCAHIKECCEQFEHEGNPISSVDCKKDMSIDRDTAECAVESIRRWWQTYGKQLNLAKRSC